MTWRLLEDLYVIASKEESTACEATQVNTKAGARGGKTNASEVALWSNQSACLHG
jgi:hypothetical protein